MNKLFLFIFCYYPLFLSAQSGNVTYFQNSHKPANSGIARSDMFVWSIHLFGNNFYDNSGKIKENKKNNLISWNTKSANKHYRPITLAKNRISVKSSAVTTKQVSEINKRMKKIFHSKEKQGIFSNNIGLNVIVGELSNVVEDGSIMPPSYPKLKKFIHSYPPNSLMGYVLGSIFTPSGFYIGLSVPVPYTKTGAVN
ncbi:MAG TPA: hypothetical protein PKN41_04315 [Bacteroidales bacterium]|nr:hypothetical protein [Bacteroidales bacterium]